MSDTCHQCGQPIQEDGPVGGICAPCLWRMKDDNTVLIDSPVTGLPEVAGHVILGEISRGGMGIVYKAKQLDPEREVALKMLLPLDERREDLLQRFRVEVHALAELDHPGILPLYQVGTSGGRPWFTMKLASGGTLASRLGRRRKTFDPHEAAKLMASMADAVHHAHSHGFLHRDIKPANILFDERGDAFLADFGLAKLLDSTAHVTRSLALLGTPCYMAPEVASKGAKAATTASDLYSLGAVLYELLSGRPPFMVEGMAALVKKIVEDEPERPSTLAANVPRDLELVCLTCLAKDPRQRYATAKDAADDLRRWLNGEPVAARRASTAARLWSWARRRPAVASLAAALVLAVLGSGTTLAILNYQLNRSLKAEQAASERAEAQSEFLIGSFAGELKKIGRLELILQACETAAANDKPENFRGYKRRARLLLLWASALWAKGDSANAAPKLRDAVQILDDLVSSQPNDQEVFSLGIEARCRLAEVLADTTSFSGALAQLEQADHAVASPGVLGLDQTLRLQADVDLTRARIWNRYNRDEPETAITAANRAVAALTNWQARAPEDRARTLPLAQALREAGRTWYQSSGENPDPPNLEQALLQFTRSAELMRGLTERQPDEEFELAYAAGWMGDCLLRMGGKGPAAAAPLHQEEFDIVSNLVAKDPLNGEWQHKLANSHFSLAEQNHEAARIETAAGNQTAAAARNEAVINHWTKHRLILRNLHEEAPSVRSWALNYLIALRRDGHKALENNDPASAAQLLKECAKVAAERVTAMPDSVVERENWKNLTREVGYLLTEHGDPASALEVYQNACSIAEIASARPGPGQPWWEATFIHFQRKVADTNKDSAVLAEWLAGNLPALEKRAAAAGNRAASEPNSLPNCKVWRDLTEEIGDVLQEQKDWPRAMGLYSSARDLALKASTVPGAGQLWWEWTLAHYHRRVAGIARKTGDRTNCHTANLRALEIRERHLRTRSPYALKDPEAVANSFQATVESLLAKQPGLEAIQTATNCLNLYLFDRAIAGPAYKWAEPVLKAVEGHTGDKEYTAAAKLLAAEAAAKLYPPDFRAKLSQKDRAALAALEAVANPPQQ
jgi:hypothetical protein